ncbi:hypothetical protein I79_024639 [Cricetulus griseus]|uniref:Uncharacterized protein n=1 Tax=Cricetulus griseus TaxID=10029 RepID=G3IL77_CRIGR|nr:hypothetical protein I79_024639 [Cricetulus griseus]
MAFLMQRHAQQSLAHDGILAFRKNLQARLFFGKSKTCSSGNFGDACWWHSSILVISGCLVVVSFTLGGGVGTGTLGYDGWLPGAPQLSCGGRKSITRVQLTASHSFSLLVLETSAPITYTLEEDGEGSMQRDPF